MLTKWFGTRTPRQTAREYFVRPELEALEDRLPPSSLQGMSHGNGNGNGHGNGNGGDMVNQHNNQHVNIHVNEHNSFDNTIMLTNVLQVNQQVSVQGFLAFSSFLSFQLNSAQIGALLNDQIALAVDAYLLPFSVSFPTLQASLQTDITNLQAAINVNPFVATPFGQVLGSLAFNVTLNALQTAQAHV